MYVLDTDTASNYLDRRRQYPALRERILKEDPGRLFVSIITIEELFRGATGYLNTVRTRNPRSLLAAYAQLQDLAEQLPRFNILAYDQAAEAAFQHIPAQVRRHHPQDCRIAATAIPRQFLIVTRNQQDFAGIPGVRTEDWTLPLP